MSMNVALGNKINFSLYLFKVYKSKYLEENKDRVMSQDEISENMDKLRLLYLFNVYPDQKEEDYIKFIKKFGTKVNVSGYGYNLDRIADILNAVGGLNVSGKNLILLDNKVDKDTKIVTIYDANSNRRFKININEKNKEVIVKKDFVSYGINMLCMDEVENIDLDDEFLISKIDDIMNKNGGYINDIKTLYLFEKYIGKSFIRKWTEENMFVSIVINNGFEFCPECGFYGDYGDWEVYEDEDDEEDE